MTASEAYCCYMLYIRPKLTYPLPCVVLTQAQCHHIQAPVLEAILPKLHLNRHTPRAVLFSGPRYGGLSLPEEYMDMGCSQLRYFVGHLKLGDEVGKFILSLITHTQLQVGSSTPFFGLPFPNYAKWINNTWATSIWKYTHQAKVTIDVEHHWAPSPCCQDDAALMDLALTFHLETTQLYHINLCRLYLQVFFLSDIVTAKGDRLLQEVITGSGITQRQSLLDWPDIPLPPRSSWLQWTNFLAYIANGNKLHYPLGQWTCAPQYRWFWFMDSANTLWEQDPHTELWTTYFPVSTR
jgi:hypothetical protein